VEMKHLVCVLLVAGCTVKEKTETGPVIHIDLEAFVGSVTDTTDPKIFTLLSNEDEYRIDVSIQSTAGQSLTDGNSFPDYHELKTFDATFTVPGVTFPAPIWRSDNYTDATFTLTEPLHIPAANQGKALAVHVAGVDDSGLASNALEFSIALR
ncbi:MAG TPA: hypothetical protein VGC41_14740, partial [Kofleriaceae bacterium]